MKTKLLLIISLMINYGFSQNEGRFKIYNTSGIQNPTTALSLSGPVDSYSTGILERNYTVVIPFNKSSLEGSYTFESAHSCGNGQPIITVNFNGGNYTPASNQTFRNSYKFNIPLNVGSHIFIVKGDCLISNTNYNTYSNYRIKINVVRDSPNMSLTKSQYCIKNPSTNLFTGVMGIYAKKGTQYSYNTYGNRSLFYIKITNSVNTCNSPGLNYHITSLSNLSFNSLGEAYFYNCSSSGEYQVRLSYSSKNIFGNFISNDYSISNGELGWYDYNFSRRFTTCLNSVPAEPDEVAFKTSDLKLYPNPANEFITINVGEFEKIISYSIFDNSGFLIKKVEFKSKLSEQEINLNELSKGFYIINIETDKVSYKDQIIKE